MSPDHSKAFDLTGRIAIVTGGNGGIGLGMARGLAAHGATIVVAARNPEKNEGAVTELRGLGATAEAIPVDVADEASCNALVASSHKPPRWLGPAACDARNAMVPVDVRLMIAAKLHAPAHTPVEPAARVTPEGSENWRDTAASYRVSPNTVNVAPSDASAAELLAVRRTQNAFT